MGLFDIFRRKKKQAKQAEEKQSLAEPSSQEEQSAQPSAADEENPASQQKAAEQSAEQPEDAESTDQSDQTSTSEQVNEDDHGHQQSADHQATANVADEDQAATSEQPEEASAVEEPADKNNESAKTQAAEADNDQADRGSAPSEDADKPEDQDDNVSSPSEETQTPTETDKYDRGLKKSRTGFGARLNRFLANFRHVDEDFFEDLEDLLIESDVGVDMAMKLSDELRDEVKLQNAHSKQDVSNVIIEKMVELYEQAGAGEDSSINWAPTGPTVIMFVGVNGAGKTTTIGKMAMRAKKAGKKVLLAAADTFRAGATEQLEVWAERDGVDIVTGPENGDPAAVVFDAVQKAKEEDFDVLFVDTAGRLQNKVNLMKELAKMKRILTREIPDAPHEVLLVLDATTGQNALTQAKMFKESTDVTGIVLTKLDGTARGGIVLAIRNELHLPVKFVGLGEQVDDLQAFNASEFVYGLFKGLVTE